MPRIVGESPRLPRRSSTSGNPIDPWPAPRSSSRRATLPAGQSTVDAEVETAPPLCLRLRQTQRTHVPRRWHPCDAPAQVAQVARTAVAVDAPQHDAVDDAAAAAAMMDVDAEVEATPPPRPRTSCSAPSVTSLRK